MFVGRTRAGCTDSEPDVGLLVYSAHTSGYQQREPKDRIHGKPNHTKVSGIVIRVHLILTEHLSGPFDTSSSTPLQLLIDIKTDGVECVAVIYS